MHIPSGVAGCVVGNVAELPFRQTVWSVTGPPADLQKVASEWYKSDSLVGEVVFEKGLYEIATSLHLSHVSLQKSLGELLHSMGVVRGVLSMVYSSPEYGLHFCKTSINKREYLDVTNT